jgi:hypothetical protein
MFRRLIAILMLAGFVTLVTGTGFLVHMHIWHAGHGADAHHDSGHCGVCHLVATAAKAVVVDPPGQLIDVDRFSFSGEPLPGEPELVDACLPIIPRAPPLIA